MSMATAESSSDGSSSGSVLNEINVTPMVDVMLVLLIIFMVVTPALLTGFQAQLPEGQNLKQRPDDDQRVTLGIDVDGRYYLNRVPIATSAVPGALKAAFDARPQDKVLFLKADRNLPYEKIMEAMKIGRDNGARVLAAVSEGVATEADDGADAPVPGGGD